ncbi:MAG TPA: T9SS type A sorting domain-containing protein, partial [Bacteroidia bacterium]|nr:T9SS type A sorting domain-containing protein [Bacteroidia bacterium]
PHPITWIQNGDFEINGGQLQTSMESGTANISFNGNFNQLNGIVCFKNKSGNTNISIAGNFKQSGGICKFYDNITLPLSHSIQLNVLGNFIQEQGRIDFCNNGFSTGNTTLQISGGEYQTTGGEIVNSSSGSYFGNLKFCRNGLTNYFCSLSHSLAGIKQSIESNCKLEVNSNDYQISSGSIVGSDYLEIKNGAQLNLKNAKIITSGLEANSGIKLETNSAVRIASEIGTEALSFPLGITAQYSIDKLSTIELNGSKTNITKLRGQSDFILGKLKINLDPGGEANLNSDLSIESQLNLCEGYINLNKTSISILNNSTEGIVRTNGYIVCNEKEGTIKRTNNQLLNYEFPFGTSSGKYIPIFINCKSGTGKCLSANTISTNRENTPLPSGLTSNLASSINAISDQIDRWWKIEASGITADVTLAYASEENSTDESKKQENFSVKYNSGTHWSEMIGNCRGAISNTGKITVKDINPSATYTLLSNGNARPAEIIQFDAIKKENDCELKWTTENELNCKEYSVERSNDNIHFEPISTVNAKNNSENSYQHVDNSLPDGKYFYRIKIKSLSGTEFYSETRIIEIGTPVRNQEKLEVKSVYPNPFSSKFTISYFTNYDAVSRFKLISMSGQTLFTSEKMDKAGENTFEYTDELRLPPGYYLLNVISGTQTFTSKIYKNAY